MVILGVILLIVAYVLVHAGVPVPPFIPTLLDDFGWILVVVGLILLILSFFGVAVGRGVTTIRGRRTWL